MADTRIDRRELLLGAGGAALAAGTMASPALAGGRKRPGPWHDRGHGRHGKISREHISIQLYTLRDQLADDLDGTLAALAQIGYRKVEHAGFAGRTAAEFRDALRRAGLRASSGHHEVPQPWDEAAWRAQVADAVTLGQRYIVTPISPATFNPDGSVDGLKTVAAWKAYAADLNRAGAIARRAGLRFGFHNHFWEFAALEDDSPLVGFDIMLSDTDPRLVHFELDLYWAWYAHRDPVQLLAYAGHRIRQFHVKDMTYGANHQATFADPGTGVIDFERIFRAAGGPIEYIVERDDAGAAALNTAKVGFEFLAGKRRHPKPAPKPKPKRGPKR
jgi:sugar phosphate isomerase/epimerase